MFKLLASRGIARTTYEKSFARLRTVVVVTFTAKLLVYLEPPSNTVVWILLSVFTVINVKRSMVAVFDDLTAATPGL